jgi:hypothetical protein
MADQFNTPGDFNRDGAADLAVGVRGEPVGSILAKAVVDPLTRMHREHRGLPAIQL